MMLSYFICSIYSSETHNCHFLSLFHRLCSEFVFTYALIFLFEILLASPVCSLIYLHQSWKKEGTYALHGHIQVSLCLHTSVLFSLFSFPLQRALACLTDPSAHILPWLIRTCMERGGHLMNYSQVNLILTQVSVISSLKVPVELLSSTAIFTDIFSVCFKMFP